MSSSHQSIIPHLWYDDEALEAARFYTSVFPRSEILSTTTVKDTPSGDCDQVTFDIMGQKMMAISAGPLFTFNPSVSFMVNFDPSREKDASEKLDEVWKKLSEDGTALMPLDKYPFSEKYGWIQDKYGVSWQLILTNPDGDERPDIISSFLFVEDNCGKAEEAREFYLSIFKNAEEGHIVHFPKGMEPDKEGTVMFSDFRLMDHWITANDSAHAHHFNFNEAISLMVYCDSQEEIDYYWDKLSAVPESEQCGWLKDKYGISGKLFPVIWKT